MYTTDFSRTPPAGRGRAMIIAEGRSDARRRDGVVWRHRVRDDAIRAELVVFDTAEQARRAAAAHRGRTRLLIAEDRGYSNGGWRAEDGTHGLNERFHPVRTELRDGREPPPTGEPARLTRRPVAEPAPRQWTIFDSESLFLGANRFRHPIAWLHTARYWWAMLRSMYRMPGTVWHGVYWQFPFTLGTVATFRSTDDMMRFARVPEHRYLMQWIARDTRNATAGFIRIHSAADQDAAQQQPAGLELQRVQTETQLREFLAVSRRGDPATLAVPLLTDTVRSWFAGRAAAPVQPELYLARRGDRTVGRTTIHADPTLDAKLGTRATLFGATWAATRADYAELLDAIADRGRRAGHTEAIGPMSLLPNQTGGVITSGFEQPGFFDSPWNPSWVPQAYADAGFQAWNESDTWQLDVAALRSTADRIEAPAEDELAAAGIRLRPASRLRFRRDVEQVRGLLNACFAQLPYYTEISPAQMRAATSGLIALMDPGLWVMAEDRDSGAPVGFTLMMPDPVDVLRGSGGRIGPRELVRLLRGRTGSRDVVAIIQGVLPEQQGRGISGLMWRRVARHLIDAGYRTVRATYIGRDNPASARSIQRLGGRPLHGLSFYRRNLGDHALGDHGPDDRTAR
ncbi:hypothetical protein [Microlunatus soli]|uniref:N-acetyltransferase domain-containing protein n=1 Tax=Microlunatus soli TaxID=630515 RepID=A0A1H1WUA4_9ACTN|nr:hypothetical protein [Microlunatus soli]SDT00251.1 hypothetical protein SAMN04489812_3791 [Microlunatus soli]